MDVLEPFAGRWSLSREVDDRLLEVRLRFEGEAVLSRDEEGLVYEERGAWTEAPWGRLTAERRYLWRPDGQGGIAVFFADGRPFHHFAPDGGATAEHWCDPDTYAVRYAFDLPEEWRSEWRVTGPRKDYTARTTYRR